MRVKVHYQREIHIVELKEYTLEELRRCVRAVFLRRLPSEFDVQGVSGGRVDDRWLEDMARGNRKMEKLHVKECGEDWMMQSFMSEESDWQLAQEINDLSIEQANNRYEPIKQTDEVEPQVKKGLEEQVNLEKVSELLEDNKIDKLDIQESLRSSELQKEKQVETIVLNEDIQCDGCFVFPIFGIIYKCLACPNYDLCSNCEPHTHIHHPFLKVAHSHHYPITTDIVFSRRSYQSMREQQAKDKKAEADTLILLKKEAEMQSSDRWEVPLSDLKSRKVCSPNFLTSIVNSLQ